jgi:hypothetical protein
MVASCAGAALGCYLVSLRVASERAALENVETQIVSAQRDMRTLQTEIGTRGRLAQLERWNVKVLALSAPSADQFLKGGFELARLTQPEHKVDFQAPVVLAAAPEAPRPTIGQGAAADETGAAPSTSPAAMLHVASLKTEPREVRAPVAETSSKPVSHKAAPVAAAKSAAAKTINKSGPEVAKPTAKTAAKAPAQKSVDKPQLAAAKPVTKAVRIAKTDPLAPLPAKATHKTSKD